MKRLFVTAIIFTFIVSLTSISYGFSLFISPSSYKATVAPGLSVTGDARITNEGNYPIGIKTDAQDWIYNEQGSKTFLPPGTNPFSCAKWIRLFPSKFKVEANSYRTTQFTINAPEDAEGGYYAVVFFESFSLSEDDEKGGDVSVQFAARLGMVVYLTIEGKSTTIGSIKTFTVTPPSSTKPLEMTLQFKNDGNTHISSKGTLSIIDKNGNIFGREAFGPFGTLPGDIRDSKVEWFGELDKGTYDAVVTLDIGTDTPLVEEMSFTVSAGGRLDSLKIDTSAGQPEFTVVIKNEGDLNIETGGNISIADESGNVVKTIELKDTLVAPGKERELKANLEERLPAGSYKAKACIKIGKNEYAKEEDFLIK